MSMTRPLDDFAERALHCIVFGLIPPDPAYVLDTAQAHRAVADLQARLSVYVHTVLGADAVAYAQGRTALGPVHDALAELWAALPGDGLPFAVLESDVRDAVSAALASSPPPLSKRVTARGSKKG